MARRILLLITDLQIGGTPTIVRELAIRLHNPPAVTVDVACLAPWGPVADQLAGRGLHVFALDAASPTDVRVVHRLVKLIQGRRGRGGYDTVFSFLVHANASAAAAAPFCRGTTFIQSIQTTQPEPRWHWATQKVAQQFAQRVVVPSQSVAEVARKWSDVPDEKLRVISNAIDPAEFPPLHGADHPGSPPFVIDGCDGSISRDSRPHRVGFIGRLDPIKRIPDLIAAIRLLGPNAHLDIFGHGDERAYLEALIAHLRLSKRVTLHGAIDRPQAALRQIDLLVLPSTAEGFGMVLIEAMACGVPVVATNVPGIRDVVIPDRTGLLVDVGSPPQLAAAIRRVLTEPDLRGRLLGSGRADVLNRFTWDAVIPQYRELLRIMD